MLVSLVLTIGTNFNIALSAGPPDQTCDASLGGYMTLIRDPDKLLSQTFTPNQNRLSRITIQIFGDGTEQGVGMVIFKDSSIIAFNTNGMVNEPVGYGEVSFEYDDVELTPGYSGYKILPIYSIGNTAIFWHYLDGCYDGGVAYMGSVAKSYDFGFATYGFDYVVPVDPSVDDGTGDDVVADDTSTPTTTITGTESTPTTKTTSASIKKATELTAVDTPSDQGGSIDLAWTKSTTTDVEGYQVYRKDSEDADFEAVVAVDKDQLTYTDSGIETNKIYFYSVRAYKGSSESVDSNEAQAEAVDNLAPEAPKNFKLAKSTTEAITLSWDANGEEDLDGYYLTVIKHGESNILKLAEISKDETGYVLNKSDLEGDLDEVSLYLQAKDANGNFSDRSGPVTSAFVNSASTMANIWVIIICVLVLAGIIVYLVYRRRKNKKIN